VVTVHDAAPVLFPETYPRRGRWFHRRGMAAAARRADLVITVSHAAAREITERTDIAPELIRVVPNGVDLVVAADDEVRDVTRSLRLDDRPYVLWVGSFEPRKNVGTLVEGFARAVSATDLPHRLALVGPPGWLDEARTIETRARPLGERVRFTGALPPQHLRALYRGADLFTLPSIHEGFGIPVLEAMAQGAPVACADIPALREVAGDAARLIPARDVDAWATALGELLADEDARRRLAAEGPPRASGFSWERCAAATADVYREAFSSSNGSARRHRRR
jgi:glycosyltransferase involved in cell wall biosynthesis